jgi:hypothetical protein
MTAVSQRVSCWESHLRQYRYRSFSELRRPLSLSSAKAVFNGSMALHGLRAGLLGWSNIANITASSRKLASLNLKHEVDTEGGWDLARDQEESRHIHVRHTRYEAAARFLMGCAE